MAQPDQELMLNPEQYNSNGNSGNVTASSIQGSVQTGSHARMIQAGVYIENQTIGVTEEKITEIVASLNASVEMFWNGDMPYVGLRPFSEKSAALFFGRSKLVNSLVARIDSFSFTCITGPSGSGKSSLLHAGLLHKLKQGQLAESNEWLYLTMTPKSQPFAQLARGLTKIEGGAELSGEIRSVEALLQWVEKLPKKTEATRIVLAIDQFEELFTQTKEEKVRQDFAKLLLDIANHEKRLFKIVIAVRSDFFGDCLNFPDYAALLNEKLEIVGAMSVSELSEAIIRPAQLVGASLETSLVTRLILDVKGDAGALPLIQLTLDKLFRTATKGSEKQKGDKVELTLAAYQEQGTIQEIVQNHANAALDVIRTKLSGGVSKEQVDRILTFFFCQLVEIGQGRADTRRTVELDDLTPSDIAIARTKEIADELATEGVWLVMIDAPIPKEEPNGHKNKKNAFSGVTVTLAHERLLDLWAWLHDLVRRERSNMMLRDEIRNASAVWVKNQRSRDDLYSEPRLNVALEQIKTGKFPLNRLTQEFIAASQRKARWRRLRSIGLWTTFLVLFVPGLFVGANLWMFQRRAKSDWQPIDGFPSHVVTAVASIPSHSDKSESILCVGTNHIGVGCSNDGSTWNLYQSGLPRGNPARIDSQEQFWGALLGSSWSGRVRAIFDLAIDPANPARLVTFVRQDGLYESRNQGVSWQPLILSATPVSFPTSRIAKLHVENNLMIIASGRLGPEEDQGRLFVSVDSGKTFPIDFANYPVGKIRDFWFVTSKDQSKQILYFISKQGFYRSSANQQWNAEQIIDHHGENEFIRIVYDSTRMQFFLVDYDHHRKWSKLFRFTTDNNELEQFGEGLSGGIIDLAINPGRDVSGIVWALSGTGQVFSFDTQGQLTERGSRPGWLWSQTNLIWFAPDPENGMAFVPYLGHADGILKCSRCLSVPK